MYIPERFRWENQQEVREFVAAHPFAVFISSSDNTPQATHIPLIWAVAPDGETCLVGHLAKANPQWKTWNAQQEVLAIFSGPHAYISSSWYESPNVSTWNYLAVHIYGNIEILATEELLEVVTQQTAYFEAGQEKPMNVGDMPQTMVNRELKGIVGFRLHPKRVEAKAKLSQNRNERDFAEIIRRLKASPNSEDQFTAKAMQEERDKK